MKDTRGKGDISEAVLVLAFLRAGYMVLKPLSDRHRFDLVIDRGFGFEKVQCKTGRVRRGAVVFSTCSSARYHGGTARNYLGDADLFGIYCPDQDTAYLVPVKEMPIKLGSLRLEPTKNSQRRKIRMAASYQLAL